MLLYLVYISSMRLRNNKYMKRDISCYSSHDREFDSNYWPTTRPMASALFDSLRAPLRQPAGLKFASIWKGTLIPAIPIQRRLWGWTLFPSSRLWFWFFLTIASPPHPSLPIIKFVPAYIIEWRAAVCFSLLHFAVGRWRAEVMSVLEAATCYAKGICRTAYVASPWPGIRIPGDCFGRQCRWLRDCFPGLPFLFQKSAQEFFDHYAGNWRSSFSDVQCKLPRISLKWELNVREDNQNKLS